MTDHVFQLVDEGHTIENDGDEKWPVFGCNMEQLFTDMKVLSSTVSHDLSQKYTPFQVVLSFKKNQHVRFFLKLNSGSCGKKLNEGSFCNERGNELNI